MIIRRITGLQFAFTLMCLLASKALFSQTLKKALNPMKAIETGFITAPKDIQTSVYWYWISDNISKEGVVRDLESMKRVGINRAFIGNVAIPEVPYGKVKLLSEEWWEIMHIALKTATRLNIEIGIFNSPGWSQSGGPWVKPSQAMRYLTSSEIMVKGPMQLKQALIKPESNFQDVKVIAYPVPADFNSDIFNLKPKFTSTPALDDLASLTDHNDNTGITFKAGENQVFDLETGESYTARSVTITPLKSAMKLEGMIQVKSNGSYVTVKQFSIDRSNSSLNVGFKPYGTAAITIPETASKSFRIVFTNVQQNSGISGLKISAIPVVENYIEKTLAKMWQTPFPYWDSYQWPVQPVINDKKYVIDPARVIDISKFMAADSTLTWPVPPGNWVIERTGMTPTNVQNGPASPEGTGLETDKMSKEHISAHFDAFLGQIIKRIPAADRKSWKVTVEDSYETGGQNWTDGVDAKYKQSFGYDPTPYMPVLQGKIVGSADQSDRFLWDLRRFIADKVAYEYVAGLRDISHKHGLTTWLENYGHWGFPGEFLQYGGQSDEVGGEFWSVGSLGDIENRAASSCAHIYGKNKVSAESFTSGDPAFSRYPAKMKQRADRFFTEGINHTLLHVYIEQPYEDKVPGVNANFGNEFNRNNTWFYDMDIFLQYIKRCNMLLQQGRYVADVAYFISEDAPKMTGTQDPEMPKGYSFDYINAEVLKTRITVKNGRLYLPDGLSYGVLVLPKLETIRPEMLSKIKELVEAGAVVLGPKPLRSPSLQNYGAADNQVQLLAAQLWGNINGTTIKINKVGKGMVAEGMALQELLDLIQVKPDLKITSGDPVLFIHRTLKDGEVYFLSNQQEQTIKFTAQFRVAGKIPELWDPVTGSTRPLPDYTQTPNGTSVPLELAATGSAFIIFRNASPQIKTMIYQPNYPNPLQTVAIDKPWQVSFDSKMRGPVTPVAFASLTDWSQNENEAIKYYSGSANYKNSFTMAKPANGEQAILNLGEATAIAKVTVNGIPVGGAWTYPYTVNITTALKHGKNDIEIKVTNTWVNRLIGDSKLPTAERKTSLSNNPYNPQSTLERSGLLGPVTVNVVKL